MAIMAILRNTKQSVSVAACRLSWNPASLFFKELSVLGLCLSTAPVDELAEAIAAVGAGTAKGGWVLYSILYNHSKASIYP